MVSLHLTTILSLPGANTLGSFSNLLKEKLDILWMNLVGVIKKNLFKNKLEVIISWMVHYLSKKLKSPYQRSFLEVQKAKSSLLPGETK